MSRIEGYGQTQRFIVLEVEQFWLLQGSKCDLEREVGTVEVREYLLEFLRGWQSNP